MSNHPNGHQHSELQPVMWIIETPVTRSHDMDMDYSAARHQRMQQQILNQHDATFQLPSWQNILYAGGPKVPKLANKAEREHMMKYQKDSHCLHRSSIIRTTYWQHMQMLTTCTRKMNQKLHCKSLQGKAQNVSNCMTCSKIDTIWRSKLYSASTVMQRLKHPGNKIPGNLSHI